MSLRAPTRTGVRPEIQAALTSLAWTQAAGQWVIPALLLVCASITTAAAQSAAPQPLDVLDEVVVANEHERERQPSPTVSARNPDVITITRGSKTLIEIQPYVPASAIRFRRDSAARQLIETPGTLAKLARNSLVAEGRQLMRVARIELDKFGVKLQIRQDQLGVTAQVVSLQHFHNDMN
jgi:DNA-directed RNA polymerase subunit H (RpoH/RPB5)